MRIAMLGGTGRIGGHLLTWALEAGHEVSALAREPAGLTTQARSGAADAAGAVGQAGAAGVIGQAGAAGVIGQAGAAGLIGQAGTAAAAGSGLTVVAGSATDPEAVAAVVDGADAVLSALGPRGARTPDLLGSAGRNIIAAMDQAGPRRLICVSAAGAFIEDDPDMGALMKMILPRVLAKQFADVRAMEAVVSASGLDWTLVRPTRLVNTPQTGRYRVRPGYAPPGGRKISRADVAHFIGTTLEQGSWLQGMPALAY